MSVLLRRGLFAVAVLLGIGLLGVGRPLGQSSASPQAIAPRSGADLQSWNRTLDQMQRAQELSVVRTDDDPQIPGRRHERLRQQYRGVPVWGTGINRQLDGAQVLSVFGTIYNDISVPTTTPRLSGAQARDVMARLSGSPERGIQMPELTILPKETGGFALTYEGQAWSDAGPVVYFIDAGTGATVWQYSNLQTQSAVRAGTGVLNDRKKVSMRESGNAPVADDLLRPPVLQTYTMKDNLTRTKQFLAGAVALGSADLATATSDPWTDGASVDAHVYAGWTYDFYFKRFGRRGLNGSNRPIISIVHPVDRNDAFTATLADLGVFYMNAFWNPVRQCMVYGVGLPPGATFGGRGWNYVSGALDVVAHELTHAVTEYTSGLIYLNESGALNESFSDMMGTSTEFYFQSERGKTGNYLIGEDVVSPVGLRSMQNPVAYGDPDHYLNRYTGTQDNGGVHTNSGIPNAAFYLAIEGGTNRVSGVAVTGVGAANREQIEKVFYRAFTVYLSPNSNFAIARLATILAARDLYGSNSAAERAVTQAWTAVGVN